VQRGKCCVTTGLKGVWRLRFGCVGVGWKGGDGMQESLIYTV